MLERHARLIEAMAQYDRGNVARIQHFVKVHGFAAVIGTLEGLDGEAQFILETAAILHDIGIRRSVEKYGSYTWKSQEAEGPDAAEALMRGLGGYTEEQVRRVRALIAHHHTYDNVDGLDHQILLEADLLVNLFESRNREKYEALVRRGLFRTAAGLKFLHAMFEDA